MLHAAGAATDSGSNVVPILTAVGAILLGLGGLAAVLTARAQRKNYVTTGFQNLTEAAAKATAAAEEKVANAQAAQQRAEYMRDQWREAFYDVRDEAVAQGISLQTRPPTEHPSEAP